MRSVLDLDINELEKVLGDNALPADVGLQGIEERSDFDKLFKHRLQPKYIAQILLKEKLKTRVLAESPDIKNERLAVKQAELELKKLRLNQQTQMQSNIYKRLQAIESGVQLIVSGISGINERLDQLLSNKE